MKKKRASLELQSEGVWKKDRREQPKQRGENKQALYLEINFIWIKKITIIKIYALLNKTQQKFLQFTP